jgi:flagellar biosynthetic protein FlhB
MSEERTQPASKRRRQLARQQGQAAHSPELTAAGGWLAAIVLLVALGDDLALGLTGLVRGTLTGPAMPSGDPGAVVAHVRALAVALAWPLAAIVAAFAAGALVTHQLQVHGLWTTRLLVPDPARLWALSSGPGLAARAERSVWSMVKAVVLVAVSAWTIRAPWYDFLRRSALEGPMLAQAAGQLVLHLAWALTAALLVLGLVDYGLRYRKFEAMLRSTPQEHREDQRVMEGDPATRAQQRRVARNWRGDTPDLLAGSSLLLLGPGGLTLVLAGGPPPRKVTVRTVARGNTGLRLRRSAEASQVRHVEAPGLANRLARRPAPGSPLAAELMVELGRIWAPR